MKISWNKAIPEEVRCKKDHEGPCIDHKPEFIGMARYGGRI